MHRLQNRVCMLLTQLFVISICRLNNDACMFVTQLFAYSKCFLIVAQTACIPRKIACGALAY